jgi:hypothetical protein
MSGFDPYHTWLGIPKADQPPHHYRLLGIQAFESDPQVIDNAADRLMIHLRTFAAGPNGPLSQKLLNEVAAARSTLQTPRSKTAYDAKLQAKLEANRPAPQAPQHIYVPVPMQMPTMLPPMPVEAPPPPPDMRSMPMQANAGFGSASAPMPFSVSGSSSRRGRRKPDGGAAGAAMGLVKLIVGSLGGIAIAILAVWIFARSDPFGLFAPAPAVAVVPDSRPAEPSIPVVTPPVDKTAPPSADDPTGKSSSQADQTTGAGQKTGSSQKTGSVTASTASPSYAKAKYKTTATEPRPSNQSQPNESEPMPERTETRPFNSVEPFAPFVLPPEPTIVKSAVPTEDEQRAKLKEAKERYKAEYDAGVKPAGRDAFPGVLRAAANDVTSDPAIRFVLLREALTRLLALKDFSTAAEVVDQLDEEFHTDPFQLRLEVLTEVSLAAKMPPERKAVATCVGDLVELAIARQRIDVAKKLVNIAEGQARTAGDVLLRTKMTELKIRVARLEKNPEQIESAALPPHLLSGDPAAEPLPSLYIEIIRLQELVREFSR